MKTPEEREQPDDQDNANYTEDTNVVVPAVLLGRSSGVHSYSRNEKAYNDQEAVTEAHGLRFGSGNGGGPRTMGKKGGRCEGWVRQKGWLISCTDARLCV